MKSLSFNKLTRLVEELRLVRVEAALIGKELNDVRTALELLEKYGWDRRIYRVLGPVMIEVPPDEARKYLQERAEALEVSLKALMKKEKELREEIEKIMT